MSPLAHPLPARALRDLGASLSAAIEAATVALVRLDERLGRSDPALGQGVRARAHLFEAQALAQLAGELVGIEELVLHDAGMDARAPGAGTVRAHRILQERRQLADRPAETVLAADSVRRLAGAPVAATSSASPSGDENAIAPDDAFSEEDDDERNLADDADDGPSDALDAQGLDLAAIDRLLARTREPLLIQPALGADGAPPAIRLRDPSYGSAFRLERWLAVLDAARTAPGALAAALALDAWLLLEPAERGGEAGWALAATVLRARGLAEHHLPALGLAYRQGRFRWSAHLPLERRLEGLLATVAASARLAQADLQRLTLAREVLLRRCEGRRTNSRLPELVGLFLALPLVTVGLSAERLGVTPQAIEAMLRELGPSLPRELTSRKRYRAWGIV